MCAPRPKDAGLRTLPLCLFPKQYVFVCRQVFRSLFHGAPAVEVFDVSGQGRNDPVGNIVLDREDILKLAVVALGPELPPGGSLDEFDGDAPGAR